MTGISFQPFTAAHLAAIQAAGNFPNLMDAYEKGQEQFQRQNRLLAQAEAAQLAQAGDTTGAINRMLSAGALEPGQYAQYQLGLSRQKAEEAQNAIENRNRQEQLAIARDALKPEHVRLYEAAGGQAGTGLNLNDWLLQQEGNYLSPDMAKTMGVTPQGGGPASSGYPQGGPGGSTLGAIYQPPQGPGGPPQQGSPPPAPPPVQQPQPVEIAPGAPPQMGNADLPAMPGVTGPPPGTTPPQAQAQAVGPVVQGTPSAPNPRGTLFTDNPFHLPPDQFARAQEFARMGKIREMWDVLKAPPRSAGETPESQIGGKLSDDWDRDTKNFVIRRDAMNDIQTAAQQAHDNPDNPGAGDFGLVYAFMHLMDPNSIVRETEFGKAAEVAGASAALMNTFNKVLNGAVLPDAARKQMVRQAFAMYKQHYGVYEQQRQSLLNRGRAQGLANPEPFVPDISFGVTPQNLVNPFEEKKKVGGPQVPTDVPVPPALTGTYNGQDWYFTPTGQ